MHPFRLHLFGIAGLLLGLILAVLLLCVGALAKEADDEADIGPRPAANAHAALDALPDWSGTWIPDIPDQNRQIKSNPTPWNAVAQKKIDAQFAEMAAGRPQLIFHDCLSENHPKKGAGYIFLKLYPAPFIVCEPRASSIIANASEAAVAQPVGDGSRDN